MTNPIRGETRLEIDDQSYRLCLTLGGLAEMEALPAAPMGATRLVDLLLILLRGGGNPLSRQALLASDIDLGKAARAVSGCLRCPE